MEYIVIFNKGRDAARANLPRVAPDAIDYPGHGECPLNKWAQKEWLRGYDYVPRAMPRP